MESACSRLLCPQTGHTNAPSASATTSWLAAPNRYHRADRFGASLVRDRVCERVLDHHQLRLAAGACSAADGEGERHRLGIDMERCWLERATARREEAARTHSHPRHHRGKGNEGLLLGPRRVRVSCLAARYSLRPTSLVRGVRLHLGELLERRVVDELALEQNPGG